MIQDFDYPDLGGGLNADSAPSAIDRSEMQELKNWYPYGTRLRRRGGVRRLTTTNPWDVEITSMFPLKTADGSWVLLVGGPQKFGKLDGSSVTDLTMVTQLNTINSSVHPWVFFQYLNNAYALRKGHNELIRLTSTAAFPAGIEAPSTAMTISEGVAGDLSAADYIAVCTFANTDSGMEGNPSPVSNTLSLAASKTIDYAGIPVSTNPFVNARRIYRTLPDQTGEYFFAFQISNNIDTTYSGENIGVVDLGYSVSFDNGLPPNGLEVGVIWGERLFASDGTDLYFSELLLPEMFSGNVISVFPDDGHVIRGLLPFGDRLLIGKTNAVHYLVGASAADFALHTLTDAHGVVSHHSFQTAEGLAFWFGTGKAVYRTDGTTVRNISTPKVANYLQAISDDLEERVIGAVYPELSWYILSIPTDQPIGMGADPAAVVLVYNYKYGSWTVFTHPDNAPSFLGDFFDSSYAHQLYATFDDNHIYRYQDTTYGLDYGQSIEASLRIKRDDFGYPGYRKFFKEVWALIPNSTTGQVQIEVFRDDQAAAILDRTASLNFNSNSGWKAWAANTFRKPGSTLDMRLTYNGQPALDLDALHFKMGLLPRGPMRVR